jgi:hypothetical protein
MLKSKTNIINIICYRLPKDISNQIRNEYDSRFKEASYLIENFSYYKQLRKDSKLIEILLSLSIFHKRFITNLDAASKFYTTVNRTSQAEAIRIGNYNLTSEENRKIYAILMMYRELRQRFGLYDSVFEYYETKQFLRQIVNLKNNRGNRNENNNPEEEENNLPF